MSSCCYTLKKLVIDFCPLMGGSSRRLHFFPSLSCGLPCWELLCRWPPPGFFPLPITAVLKGTADTGDAWGLLPTLCFAFFLAGLSIGWTFSFESASAASWAGREDLDSAGCTMVLLCGGEDHANEPEVQLPSVNQDPPPPPQPMQPYTVDANRKIRTAPTA